MTTKGCDCNPPCVLQRMEKANKAQLIEWLANEIEERDMANAYYPTLETHLRKQHDCRHDFSEIANEDGEVAA